MTAAARPPGRGEAVKERPILFSSEMVKAILAGRKSVTRRVVTPQPPSVEAVTALAGVGYHWVAPWEPERFVPSGPVWAVRDLYGREPDLCSPFGGPGDRLWVREAFNWISLCDEGDPWEERSRRDGRFRVRPCGQKVAMVYRATDPDEPCSWKPSIHMPRWASRLTLEVTSVRVERLHDITEDDARAEGVTPEPIDARCPPSHLNAFVNLWTALNGRRPGCSWGENPWLWRVEFRRVEGEPR